MLEPTLLDRAILHPALLAILRFLTVTNHGFQAHFGPFTSKSHSRYQHLKDLKGMGLIHGIDCLNVNYNLCKHTIDNFKGIFDDFFYKMDFIDDNC